MPQLDTSTWLTTIVLTLITLLFMYQLKLLNQHITPTITLNEKPNDYKTQLPWEKKWTKTYLPNLPHL